MKVLRCGDLMPGCDFEARGETEMDVLQKAAAHAKNDHGLEITPDLKEKAREAIREE